MATVTLQDVLRATGSILNKNPQIDGLADAAFNKFTDIDNATGDPSEIAIKGTGQGQTQLVEYDPVDPQLLRDSYEVRKRIVDLEDLKIDKQTALTNELRNKYGVDQLQAELDQYNRLGSAVSSPAILQRMVGLKRVIDEREQAVKAELIRSTATGFNQINHEIENLKIRQSELERGETLEDKLTVHREKEGEKELLIKQAANQMADLMPVEKTREEIIQDVRTNNIPSAIADVYQYEKQTGTKMTMDEITVKHGSQGAKIAENRYKNKNPGPVTPENKEVLQFYQRTGKLIDNITPDTIEDLAKQAESEGIDNTLNLDPTLSKEEKQRNRERAADQMRMELWRIEKGKFQEEVLEKEMRPENFILDDAPIATDAEKEAARWILTNFPNIMEYHPDTRKMANRWSAVFQLKQQPTSRPVGNIFMREAQLQQRPEIIKGEFPADADVFTVRRKMIQFFVNNLRKRYSAMESGIIDPANSQLHAIMIGGLR